MSHWSVWGEGGGVRGTFWFQIQCQFWCHFWWGGSQIFFPRCQFWCHFQWQNSFFSKKNFFHTIFFVNIFFLKNFSWIVSNNFFWGGHKFFFRNLFFAQKCFLWVFYLKHFFCTFFGPKKILGGIFFFLHRKMSQKLIWKVGRYPSCGHVGGLSCLMWNIDCPFRLCDTHIEFMNRQQINPKAFPTQTIGQSTKWGKILS